MRYLDSTPLPINKFPSYKGNEIQFSKQHPSERLKNIRLLSLGFFWRKNMKHERCEFMKGSKILISFILGGIIFRWGIEIIDLLTASLANKQGLSATKTQLEMNKLVAETQGVAEFSETQAIGFNVEEEYYYEDEEE